MEKLEILGVTKEIVTNEGVSSRIFPPGAYIGVWCGYNIEIKFNDATFNFKVNEGIRGTSRVVAVFDIDGLVGIHDLKN